MSGLSFVDVGEAALRIGFSGTPKIKTLQTLEAQLRRTPPHGVLESSLGWETLLIHYDPQQIARDDLVAAIKAMDVSTQAGKPTHWRVPICFEPPYGKDMAALAATLNLSQSAIIKRITAHPLALAFYGFAPGFAYLRGLDERLSLPRRKEINKEMAAGSFIIAAGQAALASAPMPTGWHIAGRMVGTMFNPQSQPPVLFAVGDQLHLAAVGADGFTREKVVRL